MFFCYSLKSIVYMKIYLLSFCLLFSKLGYNQLLNHFKNSLNSPKKYYFSWGYHRAFYSNSNLHFRNINQNSNTDASGNYDFVIENAKAHDRADLKYLKDPQNITIPQFNASIGFVSKYKNLGFEINYNHAKYVVDDNQQLKIKGQLFGKNIDSNITLGSNYMHIEHTDGANFWMGNVTKSFILKTKLPRLYFQNMIKIGGGMCIPRTDITFLGKQTNNKFHIAGYVLGLENGLQLHLGKHFFIENSYKYAFAYYTNAKVSSNKNAYLTHHFNSFLLFLNLGFKW